MELTADDLRAVAFLVRHHRGARLPVPPQVAHLANRVELEIRCSATGNDNYSKLEESYVSTTQLAARYGCSERHARNLAKRLGAHKIAGRWIIPEANI